MFLSQIPQQIDHLSFLWIIFQAWEINCPSIMWWFNWRFGKFALECCQGNPSYRWCNGLGGRSWDGDWCVGLRSAFGKRIAIGRKRNQQWVGCRHMAVSANSMRALWMALYNCSELGWEGLWSDMGHPRKGHDFGPAGFCSWGSPGRGCWWSLCANSTPSGWEKFFTEGGLVGASLCPP